MHEQHMSTAARSVLQLVHDPHPAGKRIETSTDQQQEICHVQMIPLPSSRLSFGRPQPFRYDGTRHTIVHIPYTRSDTFLGDSTAEGTALESSDYWHLDYLRNLSGLAACRRHSGVIHRKTKTKIKTNRMVRIADKRTPMFRLHSVNSR